MVYVFLADGFEEVEALTVVDVLRRGGVPVKTCSIMKREEVIGAHNIKVLADLTFEEADFDSCKALVLPGGLPGASHLEAHAGLAEQIKAFHKAGKTVAAICAAPMVFGTCGILEGKKATIYPGMEDRLTSAEPTYANVTVDGNIITGRGPALAMEFGLAVLEKVADKDTAEEVAEGLLFTI